MNNMFRPQDVSKKYIMQQRRLTGRSESYNWRTRVEWYPIGWKLNKRVIGRQFARLHYLACHAPEPIVRKWRPAYNTFYKKHFGSHHSSMRFANNHTAHSWL